MPVVLGALADYLGAPIPLWLHTALLAGAAGWTAFVLGHASVVAFRLLARHAAYMRALGIDLSFGATVANPKLWRNAGASMTMRESIAAMRAAQAPTPGR